MTQLTIFDYAKEIEPKEPPCYSCEYAIRRGAFRLCRKGKRGYKKLGKWSSCKDYKEYEDVQHQRKGNGIRRTSKISGYDSDQEV